MSTDASVRKRIGLIGFGFIGAQVYRRIISHPDLGLDIAFVHNRSMQSLREVPLEFIHTNPDTFHERRADLVVEMAHPDYTRTWGRQILERSDYLPLSVSALADDALMEQLLRCARRHGTQLAIPHGALMGLDSLLEWRHAWSQVEIAFFKSPENIDFSESGIDRQTITSARTLYQGPVRGIAKLFPRNVNTMITCALATIGLDRCQGRLVAVPGLKVAIAEVTATGKEGSRLTMRREQPVIGVSGTEMFESQFASILRASRANPSPPGKASSIPARFGRCRPKTDCFELVMQLCHAVEAVAFRPELINHIARQTNCDALFGGRRNWPATLWFDI